MSAAPVDPPLKLDLTRRLETVLAVWIRCGPSLPVDYQLTRVVTDWMATRLPEPLRVALQAFLEEGHLRFERLPVGSQPAPPLNRLREAGHTADEEQRLGAATHEILVTAEHPNGAWNMVSSGALAAARALAHRYDGVVLDRFVPRLLPIASYGEPLGMVTRVSDWIAQRRVPTLDGTFDLSTVGLRRLQLPDLRVPRAAGPLVEPLETVLRALAQILLHRAGRVIEGRGPTQLAIPSELVLDLEHEALMRIGFAAGELPGARRKTAVRLTWEPATGGAEAVLRLEPPRDFRGGATAWHEAMLGDLLGSPPVEPPRAAPAARAIPATSTSAERTRGRSGTAGPAPTAAAEQSAQQKHLRALEELPAIQARYEKGLPRGHKLFVKRAFPTPKGPPEYLWIQVSSWYKGMIRGQLSNVPRERKDLHMGQTLQMQEEDVYDWLLRMPDGRELGAFTD